MQIIQLRTAQRRVTLYRKFGWAALARKNRADRGERQAVSVEFMEAIGGFVLQEAAAPGHYANSAAEEVAASSTVSYTAPVDTRVASDAVYARVDLVQWPSSVALMELELIEPELFLPLCKGAGVRLAGAIVRSL